MEDEEWIVRAKGGDPGAFSILVDRYQQPVFNLCYRMLNERTEADDAAQEAFLKAYRGLAKYDERKPFKTWLFSLAAHHCIDQLRRKRFQWVSLEGLGGLRSGAEGPESALERREREQELEAALMELRATDRAVVVLRYWNELSHAEIAGTLSLTSSAVKSRLHRAKRQLAASYQRRAGQQPASGREQGSTRGLREPEGNNEALRV